MKNLFKVALIAMSMLLVSNFAKAQVKIGYVNFDLLENQMPETKTIRSQIDIYQKTFIDQLTVMNTELSTKAADFQKNSGAMTDAVRSAKQAELQDMNKRMQEYQQNAQQQVEAKTNELAKPMIDKARAAITAVAKEKGYTYVYNSAQVQMLVAPDADDLMDAVKLKLGLK